MRYQSTLQDKEKKKGNILRYATPYYVRDNSYMGGRRFAKECPMHKAQIAKELQQSNAERPQREAEEEMQNSLVQQSEQEQSDRAKTTRGRVSDA